MDQVLDAGIVGDCKVQILTDTTVTFQSVDDKVSENVVLVDQCEDILKIRRADDDIDAKVFFAAGNDCMLNMLVHE